MAENNRERLFSDFTAPSRQEWLDKITVDLKGADFNKKLVWRTTEGFSVQPFYRQEDIKDAPVNGSLPGEFPYLRGKKSKDNSWRVRQNVECEDAAAANAQLRDLLNRGVDAFGLHIPKKLISEDYIKTLLAGIPLDKVELNFRTCQGHTLALAHALADYFKASGVAAEKICGSIAFDPFDKILRKGKDTTPILAAAPKIIGAFNDFPFFRSVAVSALTLSNAGAYSYQELGYALAWGNEWMQLLTDAGITPCEAASSIKFEFGIGQVYFMEIAKFRAARYLWALIAKQYGACDSACEMQVNATTTEYNKTLFDSYVNLLRTQTETMSAALAGVDSITVTPFDSAYAEGDDFSERIARNQQLLLKEECHFDKMVDVAGGSYFVETLTDSLATEAWKLFQSIEADGGFLAQLKAGKVQEAINTTNKTRHENASKRREFILGTNQFPNFNEKAEGRQPLAGKCCCGNGNESCEMPFEKLETSRLASEFEALRLQTEASGRRPIAFMLTIGSLVMRQARAQFSCNFLACAGYQVIDNLGFKTVEEGVDAAVAAKADIVVLCSSDDEYAEYGVPAFKALNGRGIFIVAGNPPCSDDLRAAGIEYFIHVRTNQLETLRELNAKMGIK